LGAIETGAGFKLSLYKGLLAAVDAAVDCPHDVGRGIDKPCGSADGFVATEVALSRVFAEAAFTELVTVAGVVDETGGLGFVSAETGLLFSTSAREAETAKTSAVDAFTLDARVVAAGFLSSDRLPDTFTEFSIRY
jgi:hypothetical protein